MNWLIALMLIVSAASPLAGQELIWAGDAEGGEEAREAITRVRRGVVPVSRSCGVQEVMMVALATERLEEFLLLMLGNV